MKRAASILLLAHFILLGTGSLTYLHNLEHAAEDAREDALARASNKPAQEHHHDETNCAVHATLFFSFFFGGWSPPPAALIHLFVALVALGLMRWLCQSLPQLIGCRDPPARAAVNAACL